MSNRARMPTFYGEIMVASSVTGVGPGDSNGKYKPKPDSFVKAVYNKFHDKICAKIEFE